MVSESLSHLVVAFIGLSQLFPLATSATSTPLLVIRFFVGRFHPSLPLIPLLPYALLPLPLACLVRSFVLEVYSIESSLSG